MNNAQRFCPNSNMIELENLFRNYNNYVLARNWAHNLYTFRLFLKDTTSHFNDAQFSLFK